MTLDSSIDKTNLDLNAIIQDYNKNNLDFIDQSENKYYQDISNVADEILNNKNIKFVLVAGPSSSGKTTTSYILKKYIEDKGIHAVVISMDNFFINRDVTPKLPNGNYDFESPRALDKIYLNDFIKDLFEKQHAKMPLYDFKTGMRKSEYVDISINENSIVIFEGIHAHNPSVFTTHQINMFKLYVCINSNFNDNNQTIIPAQRLRLMRRLIRDFYERGHSISTTLCMWPDVLQGEDLYIKSFKSSADAVLDTTHFFEPFLYANYLLPLLTNEDQNDVRITNIINSLKSLPVMNKQLLPSTSLICEFISK